MRLPRAHVLAGTATVALLATACGGGDTAPDTGADGGDDGTAEGSVEGVLTIWTDDERQGLVAEYAADFATDNGVEVNVQALPFEDLDATFLTAHQAGDAPDVVVGAHDWIGNLVQNGAILPVELPTDVAAGVEPAALDAVTFDGQLYGVPYAMESIFLVRNTDLAPDAPETMEELVETGDDLVDGGDAEQIMVLQQGQDGDAFHLMPLFTSGGGDLFGLDEDGNADPGTVLVGSEESVAAAERIADLGEDGAGALRRSVDDETGPPLFHDGAAPFFVTGAWNIPDIETAGVPYEISPVPPFADGEEARPFLGVQAFFVAAGGENSALATEFVTSQATDPDFVTALYAEDPRPPALTAALEEVSAEDPNVASYVEAAANGFPMPSIPEMDQVWGPLGQAQADVIGGADPAATMESAHEAIVDAIEGS